MAKTCRPVCRHHRGHRAHVERPTEGKPPEAAEETRLTRLMAEADILASGDVRDLLARFLYDNPSDEEKVDIWASVQSAAGPTC